MARTIIIVNATQVVTSEQNPQGIISVVSGYPKNYDSNLSPYNGDIEAANKAAKGEFFDRVSKMYLDTNPNRVMTTVTIETADGRQILPPVSLGGYPAEPEEPEQTEE